MHLPFVGTVLHFEIELSVHLAQIYAHGVSSSSNVFSTQVTVALFNKI